MITKKKKENAQKHALKSSPEPVITLFHQMEVINVKVKIQNMNSAKEANVMVST